MELKWTSKGLSDLTRLYEFLSAVNQPAAARTIQQPTAAPIMLMGNPRLGERLEEFEPRDVRRILVRHYEMRYEIVGSSISYCVCGTPVRIDNLLRYIAAL